MRRILPLMLILTVLAAIAGSAATMDVDGGTIQAFSYPVSLQVPQEPPGEESQAGTSIEADVTASGFAVQGEGETIYGVRGTICVENAGERSTEGLAIVVVIQKKTGEEKYGDLLSSTVELGDNAFLNAGDEQCYTYGVNFIPIDGATYRNVARITITNHSGHLGEGFGPEPKADFSLPEA